MRGRAHKLFKEFTEGLSGAAAPFLRSRLILMARINPDELTPELDAPDVEARLEEAMARINAQQQKK